MSATPLHPRLAEVVEYMHDERDQLFSYVRSVPEVALRFRPAADQWSAAETLEHLALIEDGLGRVISRLVKQARAEGSVPDTETSSILGILDHYDLENGSHNKLVAPDMVRPKGEQSIAESMEKLTMSRARLLEAVHGANGLDLGRVTFPHPFLGPISAYEWLVLIAKHELRHLRQNEECRAR